jgi:hypothetical protein
MEETPVAVLGNSEGESKTSQSVDPVVVGSNPITHPNLHFAQPLGHIDESCPSTTT